MSDYSLTINNKKVFEFYQDNPNIDIVNMNLILIDFISGLGNDLTSNLNKNLLHQISLSLNNIQHLNTLNKQEIFSEINSLNNSFKLEIKDLLSTKDNLEKQNLNQNFELYFNKILKCIPESNSNNLDLFKKEIISFKKDIELLFSKKENDSQINNFLNNLDSKFNTIQTPLYNLISNNQNSIQDKISNLESSMSDNKKLTEENYKEQSAFFNKFKNSSQFKGQFSENLLQKIVSDLFPESEVKNTTASTASGDILLNRANKDIIMLENKNYENNVNKQEIDKFIRDASILKCHGIMLSQLSGISFKPDWFIEFNEGKILLYLHNVHYNPDKIKMAILIIDNLSNKLQKLNDNLQESSININCKTLELINEEFKIFLSQKEIIKNNQKDYHKKLLNDIDNLCLDSITNLLTSNFTNLDPPSNFNCDICDKIFSSKKGLASHKKCHKIDKTPENVILTLET